MKFWSTFILVSWQAQEEKMVRYWIKEGAGRDILDVPNKSCLRKIINDYILTGFYQLPITVRDRDGKLILSFPEQPPRPFLDF